MVGAASRGRRKPAAETAYSRVRRALSQRVWVRQPDGRTATMTKADAFIATLLNDALKGDPHARRLATTLIRDEQKLLPKEPPEQYGVVVIREPARSIAEWEARYSGPQTDGLKSWEGVSGFDPETCSFNGIPIDPKTGDFALSKVVGKKTPPEE